MSDDDLAWFLAEDDEGPGEESLNSLGAALDALNAETLRLIDSVLTLAFARSARGRCVVGRVLARAEAMAAMPPATPQPEELLARLDRLREVAIVALAAAPHPSAAAVACARRGDRAAWDREAAMWCAGGRCEDAPTIIALPRRRRRATQPDTPSALREAASRITTLAIEPTSDPTSDKAGTP